MNVADVFHAALNFHALTAWLPVGAAIGGLGAALLLPRIARAARAAYRRRRDPCDRCGEWRGATPAWPEWCNGCVRELRETFERWGPEWGIIEPAARRYGVGAR